MANDSTTAGWLTAVDQDSYDDALEDLIHATVSGVSGLDPTLCRPRWQPEPPNLPGKSFSWVAFGVIRTEADTFESQIPVDTVEGGLLVVGRNERLTVQLSFYGPAASSKEAAFRDGLALSQNRALLREQGIAVIEQTGPTVVPSLLKNTFLRRVDSTLILTRYTNRTYQVRSVSSAALSQLDNEHYLTPISVPVP